MNVAIFPASFGEAHSVSVLIVRRECQGKEKIPN